MENIKLALLSLKKGISESKNKASSDVNTAIIKLTAVLTFLKQDTLDNDAFSKLSGLLRRTTQPLYKQDLSLTLNFASAAFLGLQTAKVSIAKDASSKKAWEMAQSSVLAGLLDHLDDHRTAKTKGPMAQAFFSTLCKLYFPTSPDGRISTHPDLITTVFMLLSELVAGQTPNGVKFRKELNGGRRLGFAILNMKDFLPLEAALDLFANLLLTIKPPSDRTKFVQDVFDPELFHSPQLLPTLVDVTNSVLWADVSPNVMKTISSLNISFPQPFDISAFEVTGLQTEDVDKLYLESASVVLSIPTDEGDDTLVVPMRHVAEFDISPSGGDVSVLLTLNKPPIIGKKPLETKEKNLACQWTLQKKDANRFLNSLKHRKIPFNASKLDARRKLSIADAVQMDLTSDAGPPKPTQEKAIAIAKLWDGPEQSQAGADYGTTSPLMHSIFPPKSDELNDLPILDVPSVFIDDQGNFTNQPTQADHKPNFDSSPLEAKNRPKATKDVLLEKSLSLLMSAKQRSQEEIDDAQLKTARRRKTDNIVVSDLESEPDPDDHDYAPSPTPTRRRSPRLSRAPTLAKIPEGKVAPAAVAVDKKKAVSAAPPVKEVKPRPTIRTRSARNKENESPVKPDPAKPSKSLKRRASPELVVSNDDDPPLPPPKKPRLSPAKEKEKPKPRPATRYKSKMKGSTPAVIDLADDDDDEEPPKAVPKTAARTTAKKQAVESQRTGKRATQMKDRSGKAKARAAPVPANKRTTRATKRNVEMDDRAPTSIVKSEPKPIKLGTITPHPKGNEAKEAKPSSHRLKKAVWQRDSFMANLEAQNQSTPPRQTVQEEKSDPITFDDDRAPEGAFQFDSDPPLPLVVKAEPFEDPMDLISDDFNGGSDTFVNEALVDEYYVRIKGEPNTSQEEQSIVKEEPEDVVMIDLTSPMHARPASPTPVPTRTPALVPVKPHRDAAASARVEPELELKKLATTSVSVPRRQQPLGQMERKEQPEVRRLRGRAVEAKVVETKLVEKKAVEAPKQVKESVPASREAMVEVEAVQQPKDDDEEPELPRKSAPRPIEKIIQKYNAPESAHIQPQQNVKEEKRRPDYRLKLPMLHAQDRFEQKISAYPRQRFMSEAPKERYDFGKSPKEVRMKEPVIDIAEVLRAIQEVLAEKVNNRFEETRQGMIQAQLALLHQAADDLKPMSNEAAEHFNALVDLEAEYGMHRRKIMTGIDTFRKSTSQTTGALKQVIQSHGRHSLVKKFPAKLFSKPLPRFDVDFDF